MKQLVDEITKRDIKSGGSTCIACDGDTVNKGMRAVGGGGAYAEGDKVYNAKC